MRDYIRLTGVLLIVCVIAAAVLGATNYITVDKIAEQAVKANDEARRNVLSQAEDFEKIKGDKIAEILSKAEYDSIREVYEAKAGGNVVGYAIKTSPKGYGGEIEVMVGVDIEGKVSGIKVGNNSETPGLGKNATTPKFQDQFKMKNWNDGIKVIKNGTPKDNEAVAIAGATITSSAVTKGVNQALNLAKELSGK
ncbi:RnfABCDGE type electron transport complex subunit G [Lutispora sp.]|nr:RnfABCDGE type electron transport complex subunit G [Lutispora sp.]MEA4960495.1 RnfABCDGE type electron transport complex subunit G [Lutispora sp.]